MTEKSVFISYSRYDRGAAFAIRQLLEANKVKVWLDVIDIRTSSQLEQELYDSIDKNENFCLLLSPTSVTSAWVLKEIAYAKARDGLRFLPIILRSCQIPVALTDIVALDAREGFDHESVQSRLLRALCGDGTVEDSVVFTQLQRDLLAKKEIKEQAEGSLPEIEAQIASIANDPIREIELHIDPESLPADRSTVLELQLELDIFKGHMSILIARFREGHTWPTKFNLEECDYNDFYKCNDPRLDVRFRWSDYVQKMNQTITDQDSYPALYTFKFDGHEFRPGVGSLPANLEIPCLHDLVKNRSSFTLLAHNTAASEPEVVGKETDIRIELLGNQNLRVYRSSTSYKQEVLLESPSLLAEANPIRREMILQRYDPSDALRSSMGTAASMRPELRAALDDPKFNWEHFAFVSNDEKRLAAHKTYSRAFSKYNKSLYRDAYKRFQDATEMLYSLAKKDSLNMRDSLMFVNSLTKMTETWLKQDKFENAEFIATTLKKQVVLIQNFDTEESDYKRYVADAAYLHARVLNKLHRSQETLQELDTMVQIYAKLHTQLPSKARRLAWIQALLRAINSSTSWDLVDSECSKAWKAALRTEVGEDGTKQLTNVRKPSELPLWLKPADPPGWPTIPIRSATLRYSMRLPQRWVSRPLVNGTELEVWHVYWGSTSQDAEWLYISFMENASEGDQLHKWVDFSMLLCDSPITQIHDDEARAPKRRTWDFLGRLPSLEAKMKADEAYGWMGTSTYQRDFVMLGRMYVILVRRKTFAWKIVLSFMTAVLEGMPEQFIKSNDHVRAGAVLGDLVLDGIPETSTAPP